MAQTDLKQVKGKPGIFRMRMPQGTTKIVKLVEWREDYVYDTVDFLVGVQALGAQVIFFQNVQNKQRVDCNITTPRKLQAGAEMVLNQIGVMPCHNAVHSAANVAAIDTAWAIERLHYNLQINGISVAQGPVHNFPPGLGVTGSALAGGVLTNGVASPAAVPRLLVPQTITEKDNTIEGFLTHDTAAWATYVTATLTQSLAVRNVLRGYMTSAVGKG